MSNTNTLPPLPTTFDWANNPEVKVLKVDDDGEVFGFISSTPYLSPCGTVWTSEQYDYGLRVGVFDMTDVDHKTWSLTRENSINPKFSTKMADLLIQRMHDEERFSDEDSDGKEQWGVVTDHDIIVSESIIRGEKLYGYVTLLSTDNTKAKYNHIEVVLLTDIGHPRRSARTDYMPFLRWRTIRKSEIDEFKKLWELCHE